MPSSARKPGGVFIDADNREVADTVQCVHCGRHWVFVRGSGHRRGYCMNCSGITCGNEKCRECMHFLKKLDLYEAGKLKTLE